MKENVNRFLEKAAADQTLAEKLAALQEQYFAQLVTLAKEYGFELTPEDFAEEFFIGNTEKTSCKLTTKGV